MRPAERLLQTTVPVGLLTWQSKSVRIGGEAADAYALSRELVLLKIPGTQDHMP